MHAIYIEKDIPRLLLTKLITPYWPDFVWTPLSSARVARLEDPPLPGPRWIRVRNLQCGICASDLSLLFAHADPRIAPAALPANDRFYLGHEAVSIVEEVGPGVTRFKVGDRVIMDTHFAGPNCETLEIEPRCKHCQEGNYQLCENKSLPGPSGIGGGFGDTYVTHETAVYPAPSFLDDDQAALTEPLSIAMYGVMRFPPRPGDKVLIIGAGIIGLLTLMTVRALVPEAQVTIIARYPHQQEMAERLGAKHILTGREGYSTIASITGGRYFSAPLNKGIVVGGFDLIYDCVADPRTVNDALRWARAGGTVMMIGVHMAPMPSVDLTLIWYHQVNLVGTYHHGYNTWNGEHKHTYEWVFDFFRQGKLPIEGLITHRFPFSEYRRAFQVAMTKGRERAIKIMLHK